jgi:hypothetical protein
VSAYEAVKFAEAVELATPGMGVAALRGRPRQLVRHTCPWTASSEG